MAAQRCLVPFLPLRYWVAVTLAAAPVSRCWSAGVPVQGVLVQCWCNVCAIARITLRKG